MGTTNFDTVAVAQTLTVNGATIQPADSSPWATHWYVDGSVGSDNYAGTSADAPFATMDKAFDKISSGDVIHLRGRIREQLSTPVGVFDVTVLGPSPVTRHPDAHTGNNGYTSARWDAPASPTASTPLVKVLQQGWTFKNILFTGSETNGVGCIQLYRDGGSGDDERDASHAQIIGCRFATGLYGVQDSGGCARVKIYGCEFQQFDQSDNDAIVNVTGAGIGTLWGWEIKGNTFQANYSDIDAGFTGAQITDNHFIHVSLGTTNIVAIDTTGGAKNLIARNFMYCDSAAAGVINARFVIGSADIYGPNYYSDKEEYGEPAE
jgi:hypothetical protein